MNSRNGLERGAIAASGVVIDKVLFQQLIESIPTVEALRGAQNRRTVVLRPGLFLETSDEYPDVWVAFADGVNGRLPDRSSLRHLCLNEVRQSQLRNDQPALRLVEDLVDVGGESNSGGTCHSVQVLALVPSFSKRQATLKKAEVVS